MSIHVPVISRLLSVIRSYIGFKISLIEPRYIRLDIQSARPNSSIYCYEQAENEDINKIKRIINQVEYLSDISLDSEERRKFICASRNLSVLAHSALTGKGSVQEPRKL